VKNTKPKLGITGENISVIIQRFNNLPVDKGVLVTSVETGSAADKAGIEEGDIIVGADGEDIVDMTGLLVIRDRHKAGETMTLTLARSGGNIDVEVVLGESGD
jgi:serine protease Do